MPESLCHGKACEDVSKNHLQRKGCMQDLWRRCHASVFSLTFENAEGRITSGSAFKIGPYLVTNNHVIQVPAARHIVLRSVSDDAYSTALNLSFGHLEFRTFLAYGDPEAGWDFALLRIPYDDFQQRPSLELRKSNDVALGSQIALFGFQFEQPNLSMHMGYLASQYHKGGVHYLQLDSSVNHGNSGGPLIDVETGQVLGIVTRKATGLSQQFEELQKSFKQNIEQLEAMQRSGVTAVLAGLDAVKSTLAIQTQMQAIAREIGRSANVGIGYAYHIQKVRESIGDVL
jgi:S1-C subfamily serine protease